MTAAHRLIGLTVLVLCAGSAQALECRLEEKVSSASEIVASVICGDGHADAVSYPDGVLYLGMSLYEPEIPNPLMRTLVLTDEDHGHAFDLPPVTFEAVKGVQEFQFDISGSDVETHYLAAVWDQRNDCGGHDSARCGDIGFTLGRTDDDGLPLPVDALPRPLCDIETLEEYGVFDMAREEEIYFNIKNVWPDGVGTLLRANDCWSYEPSRPGLGYSVQRWRVAPLAIRE